MDLCDLPEEVIEIIAEYLSLEELCSCSEVSTKWKIAFDVNRIWKRFCTLTPKYFIKQKRKFNLDNLGGMCDCKKEALQERNAVKNTFCGNYTIHELNLDTYYCDNFLNFVDKEGNHWLFLLCMLSDQFESEAIIQLWNLNDEPDLQSSAILPFGKKKRKLKSQISFYGDKFYILDEGVLLVYKFDYKSYELEFLTSVHTITGHGSIAFESSVRDNTINFALVGQLVVGFLHTSFSLESSRPFVVWDHEYSLPIDLNTPSTRVNILHFEVVDYETVLLVYFRVTGPFCVVINIFDVNLLHYKDFNVERKVDNFYNATICGNTISLLGVSEGKLLAECYDARNEQVLLTAELTHKRCYPEQKLISEDELIILENGNIHLFNVKMNSKVTTFKLERVDCSILNILNNSLLLIECEKKGFVYEVWNFRTGNKLYNFQFTTALGAQQYKYTCKLPENKICPTKIIFTKDPHMSYSHLNIRKNKVFIINFF